MKWITLFVFFLMPLFLRAQQCPEVMIDLAENLYVKGEQIQFADNTIYVMIDDVAFKTPAIYSDECGYYVLALGGEACRWYEWKCCKCGTCVWLGIEECPICGRAKRACE
ncbi:MAG TPA: hypothetical protein VGJ00_09250 [Rhabdochlamydiaceae bacterium]|jgi:hypothetical protein